MKINDQDIIRAARQLRDEENQQFHVRPWPRRRYRLPAWVAAVPAAAIAGFVLGVWTGERPNTDAGLTAYMGNTDTVYIKVHETTTVPDTADSASTGSVAFPQSPVKTRRNPSRSAPSKSLPKTTGLSVDKDHIRYDLLVSN